jgi:hypothetical protein
MPHKSAEYMTAKERTGKLKQIGLWWLQNVGCIVYADEVNLSGAYGVADVMGMKANGDIYYLECKQSRADLICKKQKEADRYANDPGMMAIVDFYYYVLPEDVKIKPEEYPAWGVVNQEAKVIRRAKRMHRPFGGGYFEKREDAYHRLLVEFAHRLSMKAYGKIVFKWRPPEFKKVAPDQSVQL